MMTMLGKYMGSESYALTAGTFVDITMPAGLPGNPAEQAATFITVRCVAETDATDPIAFLIAPTEDTGETLYRDIISRVSPWAGINA